ncbi:gluconokinase [Enterococcus sp. BWB1-3]|uniref:gluconokinase n=1 Tax=Enterococcus sp. BWB1-3 TaxID=2787713 RepID=UPI0019228891|nr:gluconokinase [Enterococcus sp. BWB1-3]MBL1230394.1 gluconokinase [Enterococcus sp. BWB1-3]
MLHQTIVTIDVGTTAIKFTLYQNHNQILTTELRIQTYTEKSGKKYQKPLEILDLLQTGIHSIIEEYPYPIHYIALSTAMHGLMPVYEDGSCGELLIWSDNQAAETAAAFRKSALSQSFYEKTGTPIHYMSPFSKLLWLKETEQLPDNVIKWIGLKELVSNFFTGEYYLDYSAASATGLFNSLVLDWDNEILTYLSISRRQLPILVDTNTILALSDETKKALGLSPQTQLLIGASDGCLAAYAGYLNTELSVSLTLGTSGAIRKITADRELDSEGKTFCYYLKKGLWVVGGPTNNGGTVLEWLSKLFFNHPTAIFEHLDSALEASSPGAEHLLFLPYINGERAPMWEPFLTGSYQGITALHGQNEFIRAAVEGLLFNLKAIMDASPFPDQEISINGGVFRHPALSQLTADILGKDCLLSANNEPCFGLLGLINQKALPQSDTNCQYIKKDTKNESQYLSFYHSFLETAKINR